LGGLFVKDAVDFLHQFAQMERFGQNFGVAVGACLLRVQRDRGKPGDEQHLDVGQMRGGALGKLDPVDAGHHDIGEQ